MAKIVRVKILVGVTPKGTWAAVGGWSKDINMLKEATALEDDAAWHWVEADVPLPVEETLQGTVRDAD